MSFADDLKKAFDNITKATDQFTSNVTKETFERIAIKNPVLTGYSVGNWQVSTGSPITQEIDRYDPNKTTVMAEIQAKVPAKAGKNVYFSDNADYIGELEKGSSRKAPDGMVAITFAQMNEIINDSLSKVKV